MKEFNGNIWTEPEPDGRIKLGFAKRFIDDVLGECFHVMQADAEVVKKGGPLMVIETNDGLTSLKSPLSGTILVFNAKARNFPDRLVEDDVIMEVIPEGVKIARKKEVKPKEEVINNWLEMPIRQEWADLFNRAQVQPVPQPQVVTPEEMQRREEEARRIMEQARRQVARRAR